MKRQAGFTIIELMVAIVIIGILSASAVGLQAKYRQRTVGSEALVMMKQILEAEVIYFLAHEDFFPPWGDPEILVWHNGADPSLTDQQRALDAMKVFIPVDHLLDFRVVRMTADSATVEITSAGGFNLFPGVKNIKGTVDDTGKMDWPIPF
jgi:prepilin-type N-terminal cleavage/methylation domain-containing protein